MSIDEMKNQRHQIIFADRKSLTPNETDVDIKKQWIEIYNENRNEGSILADGTIVWDCPCLGTKAIGPCSVPFRTAFSCYQNSSRNRKDESHRSSLGDKCVTEWNKMQQCFAKYPKLYGKNKHFEQTDESTVKIYGHPEARRQRMKEESQTNL